jgi:biopolymer transport protein ExbD
MNGRRAGPAEPMAEINMIPLVDVMLVLLVIFIITAPLMQQAVAVDLPQVSASALEDKPRVLRAAAADRADPELQLYADRRTAYEQVARLIAAAQDAGLARIAFVS